MPRLLSDAQRLEAMTTAAMLAGHPRRRAAVAEVALDVAPQQVRMRRRRAMNAAPLPAELERVHMVGIGGAGMSGIARILLDRGGQVSGSDAKESRAWPRFAPGARRSAIGHDASALDMLPGGPTSVVTTHAAIPRPTRAGGGPRRGIPVVLRPAVLAKLMDGDTMRW